jgi:hypothetical protein
MFQKGEIVQARGVYSPNPVRRRWPIPNTEALAVQARVQEVQSDGEHPRGLRS